MEHTESLGQAVVDALREGLGRFRLPLETTSRTLAAAVPPIVVAREYRHYGLVHDLRPVSKREARPGTLSATHGLSAFPPHVDGAYLNPPPRLVVLWCATEEERRPTLVYRWGDVETLIDRQQIEREVFEYRSGRNSRASTIVGRGRAFVRYDPGCMRPATRGASALLTRVGVVLADQRPNAIEWMPGEGVVIDNWRMLHARGAPDASGPRHLLRMWLDPIEENAG